MIDHSQLHTGLDALNGMFDAARARQHAAFLPYFPIGYPSYKASLDAVVALAEEGADGFEIGIPFSDPLADGPTIQEATREALKNGTTVRTCLQAVRDLRARGVKQPMLMMSYLNPLLAYGPDEFVREAKSAGADGLIIPDLPSEESTLFAGPCARDGLALVMFLAPTTSDARIDLAARHATGFIYIVSLTGVTGARSALPAELATFIGCVRQRTDQRLVVGFGISTCEQARQMDSLADGFIVGSALVKAAAGGTDAVRTLARALR